MQVGEYKIYYTPSLEGKDINRYKYLKEILDANKMSPEIILLKFKCHPSIYKMMPKEELNKFLLGITSTKQEEIKKECHFFTNDLNLGLNIIKPSSNRLSGQKGYGYINFEDSPYLQKLKKMIKDFLIKYVTMFLLRQPEIDPAFIHVVDDNSQYIIYYKNIIDNRNEVIFAIDISELSTMNICRIYNIESLDNIKEFNRFAGDFNLKIQAQFMFNRCGSFFISENNN